MPLGAAGVPRSPLGRHDQEFGAAAALVVALSVGARIASLAPLQAYPSLHAPAGAGELALAVALLVAALAPFADRRGIER